MKKINSNLQMFANDNIDWSHGYSEGFKRGVEHGIDLLEEVYKALDEGHQRIEVMDYIQELISEINVTKNRKEEISTERKIKMKKIEEMSLEQRAHNLINGVHIISEVYEKLGEILKLKTEKDHIEKYETIRPEIEALAKVLKIEI